MRSLVAISFLLVVIGCSQPAIPTSSLATVAPLSSGRSLSLADHTGATFFDVMTMGGGIQESLDLDTATPFIVEDRDAMVAARAKFTDKVNRKVTKPFGDEGLEGFLTLIDEIAGEELTSKQLKSRISAEGVVPWSIADFVLMASGNNTTVHIDANNYYYNVSYEDDEVKSGRSFGAAPQHKADDASYPFYLDELAKHLDNAPDALPMYEEILAILTQSNVDGVSQLDEYGQTVVTDFVTIYTAELYRHIIAGLGGSAPWENDLAEATFVSLWTHAAGKIQKDGEIVDGTARDWNGFGENGSGVGITRKDRRSLQTKVCNAVRDLKPALVEEFEQYLANDRPDCYRAVMEFLNNHGTQADVRANAVQLSKAFASFLRYTRDNASDIMSVMTH
jgi:hypothetical protein